MLTFKAHWKSQSVEVVLIFVFINSMEMLLQSGDEGRVSQLQSLRTLCIPVLCFLLHTVLHNSQLYTQCLQLADIIAAEDRQLYKVSALKTSQVEIFPFSQGLCDNG